MLRRNKPVGAGDERVANWGGRLKRQMPTSTQAFDLGIIRHILAEDTMGRFQNPKIETKKGVKRPYFYIRPIIPVVTPEGIQRKQRELMLCYCDEKGARRLAEQKKQEIMAPINAGKTMVQAQIPFRILVQKFLDARAPQLGEATQAKYRQHIENHILPDLGNLRMADIDDPTVQVWLIQKKEDGLSWWTRTDLRNLGSAIFNQARKWKLWSGENPFKAVEVGTKIEVREKRLLNAENFGRLLAGLATWPSVIEGIPGPMVRVMVLIAFVTGFRISEVLGLKWSDIDWERKEVTLRRRWHRGSEGPPTTARSKRTRKLGPLLEELHQFARGHGSDEWIFSGAERVPPDDRNLSQHILRPAAKQLGLYWKGFGWHTFRRQSISWRQEAGATPFEAMCAAGHSRPDTTWLYTISDETREEEQLGRMWERLTGAPVGGTQ